VSGAQARTRTAPTRNRTAAHADGARAVGVAAGGWRLARKPPRGVELIAGGGATTPLGFVAGATYAGIKTLGASPLDLGVLASERPAAVAAMFTRSTVRGAAVEVSQRHARAGRARGVVVNSGISNVATGERGLRDAEAMCEGAAAVVGCRPAEMLVGSTGVIGQRLPIERIVAGLGRMGLSREGGDAFARAIMTTDTHPKTLAVRFRAGGRPYHIGAVAKGSGMIHPDMATMFCFVTTDVPVAATALRRMFRSAVDDSLNMMSVDGDTSTSDTVAIFANGAGGGPAIAPGTPAGTAFERALRYVCTEMARMLARDGEGAEKLIEVRVSGAATVTEARAAARTITASPLVKAAVHGNDPNWGRLLMAVGRSGARVDLDRARVRIGGVQVYRGGIVRFHAAKASAELAREEVVLSVDLGAGDAAATAWGCDLTDAYVHINSDYTT
jgi:glutamate N-acetyltransferase/amino-acid N-acetyltransferase